MRGGARWAAPRRGLCASVSTSGCVICVLRARVHVRRPRRARAAAASAPAAAARSARSDPPRARPSSSLARSLARGAPSSVSRRQNPRAALEARPREPFGSLCAPPSAARRGERAEGTPLTPQPHVFLDALGAYLALREAGLPSVTREHLADLAALCAEHVGAAERAERDAAAAKAAAGAGAPRADAAAASAAPSESAAAARQRLGELAARVERAQ